MSFDINTNITSLQAQQYLRVNSDSIQNHQLGHQRPAHISSGDDAGGPGDCQRFRSDQAVLGQGIRNAFDGLSTRRPLTVV
jgi:flagellin-like hook-associated protein FlgL